MGAQRRYQVFVSSTYLDLIEERQRVLHAVLELGCFPAGMEFFPASDDTAWEFVKDVIRQSDYYAIIIGGRYGSVDERGLSFTEREYDLAYELKVPTLVFLHKDPDGLPVRRSDIAPEFRAKLQQFREKLRMHHLCQTWERPYELSGKFSVALASAIESKPGVGWTRGRAGQFTGNAKG